MALFNNFPYTDLNNINLDYTLQKLESLYTRGEQLYSTLTTWQQATDAELEQWKAATESALALWKTQTENSIDNKIQLLTAAINTAFTELRTQLEAHIAEIETTAVNAASAASASATAAAGAASAASINNEQSKEWAIGETLEGDPVPDTNPAYENNAKYYADLLGQETEQIDQNTADITDLKSATSMLNKASADISRLNFDPYNSYGIKLIKNSDGSYSLTGTASQTVNSSRYQFAQTVGVTYHYKLNPSYDNTSSSYYFYVTGVNGSTAWNKSPEITWTATTSGNVNISLYCPTGVAINETINPVINANYTNAELYGLISNNATDIQAVNELSTSGKVILIGASDITWESAGTVINYKNGELSSGNPNTFVATQLIDISRYGNLVLTFEGHTQGDSGIVFYDENNHYVNGVNSWSETTLPDMGYRIRIQVPSNAKTCRIGGSGTKAKELSIYISERDLLDQLSKTVDFRNTMFKGGIRSGTYVYPAFPMIPTNFETYAPIAYDALIDIMTANGYDTIPVYILSDSHGNAISPFAWLNEKDDTIKCLHLGDIANDTYNTYEMGVYGAWAKRINNIATLTGNHDVLHGAETMHEYDIVKNFVTTDRHMGGTNNYYYVDDGNFRVRYIALDPYKIADDGASVTPVYQADQIAWLAETLEDTKYDVVMLSHYPLCDSAEDRSGTTFTSGPYATNQSAIQSIINAYQNKQSVSVTVGATTITADYTNAENSILCAFSGHMHHEGTGFQSGVRNYIAQNYQSESSWASAFVAIDRKGGEIKVLKFDNSQNYTEWDLSMTE